MSDFSVRLSSERKRLDLSQSEFGALGGVGKTAQFNYENDHRTPDTDYLMNLIKNGIDVLYLLTGIRTVSKEITPEEQALLDNYRNADDSGKRAAHRVLDALAKSSTDGKKSA
ncbi:helix-turn-helix domain-containing protein [Oxalobacter paraformigenes]|uniref:HTH cro/C1-type domain-containing protein n=1 Tax=Oxalobacter paraformigenes TaxID=556268 RepID=C3X1W8_9BURK|nr:helix-turn-helix transcriptional regulator [Oxalobacter paraformigenes]EEO27204.1 hypothetical protein OFAG_00357 [Oxalobacter paraformigenes]